jgi:hypothetical protein
MTPMTALGGLLAESIDFAGLFPPASLSMGAAVRRYSVYRGGNLAWLLGRFIVPVSRLSECSDAVGALTPEECTLPPWRLSAVAGTDLPADIRAVVSFNQQHRPVSLPTLRIDTLEFRVHASADIEAAMEIMPAGVTAYAEIPIAVDPTGLLVALSRAGFRAKVRTGGVTPGAFPPSTDLARFIAKCVSIGVEFKATAGLHHALRGRYRLTYEKESPAGTMYGFLNVMLATALAALGAPEPDVQKILEEENPRALQIDQAGASWGSYRFSPDVLAAIRGQMIAFGSCSFDEPVHDLQQMGFL